MKDKRLEGHDNDPRQNIYCEGHNEGRAQGKVKKGKLIMGTRKDTR